MAIFQFDNRTLSYEVRLAPLAGFDLLLLHGKRFSSSFWSPVLLELEARVSGGGGRVVTCDWPTQGAADPEYLARWLRTLGLVDVHVVAFDDAVELISGVQRLDHSLIKKTLYYPQGGPKGDALVRAVFDFAGI